MNYSARIMNLPASGGPPRGLMNMAYLLGHRDARHAAAEIASEAERRLEVAQRLADHANRICEAAKYGDIHRFSVLIDDLRTALAEWESLK